MRTFVWILFTNKVEMFNVVLMMMGVEHGGGPLICVFVCICVCICICICICVPKCTNMVPKLVLMSDDGGGEWG